jgi:hypothetical protein
MQDSDRVLSCSERRQQLLRWPRACQVQHDSPPRQQIRELSSDRGDRRVGHRQHHDLGVMDEFFKLITSSCTSVPCGPPRLIRASRPNGYR